MTNPFDQVPQNIRFWAYIILTIILLAVTAWQGAEGNILEAIGSFVASLITAMSVSNSSPNTIVAKKVKDNE